MEKFLAAFVLFGGAFAQSYHVSLNGTNFNWHPSSEILTIEGSTKQHPQVQHLDDVFRHYRMDTRRREPKFIGFAIQDDNIEIDMEMAVPFLSVPTKKSLGKKQNFVNINVASIILATIVGIVGTMVGGATRFFRGDSFFTQKPWFRTGNKKKKQKRDIHSHEFAWDIFNDVDEALLQIDFDVLACLQRSICWHVNESLMNVQDNRAGKFDKFISGFINADWSHRVISNAMIVDAIETGKKGKNCETKYHKCPLSSQNLEGFAAKIQNHAKKKH